MRYDYCLYCQEEHYPFCGANCHGLDLSRAVDDEIACDFLYDPEWDDSFGVITAGDIRAQNRWLETDEGIMWLRAMQE